MKQVRLLSSCAILWSSHQCYFCHPGGHHTSATFVILVVTPGLLLPLEKKIFSSKQNFNSEMNTPKDTIAERQKRQIQMLENARRQLYETEEVGIDTLQILNQQGTQLRQTRDRMGDVSEEISVAKKILNRMMSFWRR